MVSFDVISLYTTISIIDMLQIMNNHIDDNDHFIRETPAPQDRFFNLVISFSQPHNIVLISNS